MKVVTSIAIYAAPIWAGAMDKRTYKTGMYAAYRRSALKVISAIRTVSALVFARMMPLKLVGDIEKRKHEKPQKISLEAENANLPFRERSLD